ncbi:C40 family peptidase [Paraburkholderia strydomiana]|uniref:C40 family peptidase n=1 Tax=Paraburkholderia strydomiana TaxID=1245417 RepID=UPI0038BB2B47
MQKVTLDAIRAHAIREFPRECCGLVIVKRGREIYVECSNTAPAAGPGQRAGEDRFRLPAQEYAAAADEGEIVAIVHSHPGGPGAATEADRVACEESCVTWYIADVRQSDDGKVDVVDVITVEPSGYLAPLVGRSFAHGVLDCYALVRDWYRIERGVVLKDFERHDDWWNAGGDLYMQHYREAGFKPACDNVALALDKLKVGDVILMQIRAPVPNHAAVYLGNGHMLHHRYGRLSSRDIYGGYWLENTRIVLRYDP